MFIVNYTNFHCSGGIKVLSGSLKTKRTVGFSSFCGCCRGRCVLYFEVCLHSLPSKKMIIFKDLLTGDEMFTDSSKYKVVDGCLYEVECRHISRRQGDIQLDGANPSQEEADEGTDDIVESGLDLVLNQRLIETGFSKNDYKVYLKGYTKALQDKWKEMEKSESEINEAKTKLTEAVKKVLPKLSDLQFFMGESSNPDGLIALLEYRQVGEQEVPIMIFFKHGLEEEKV